MPGPMRQRSAAPTARRTTRQRATESEACQVPSRARQRGAAPTVRRTTTVPEACQVPSQARQQGAAPRARRRATESEACQLPGRIPQPRAAPTTRRRTTVSGAWRVPGPTRQRCAAPTVPPTARRQQSVSMSAAPEARWAGGSRLRLRVGPGVPRAAWPSPAAPAARPAAGQRRRWRVARCGGCSLRPCPGAACLLLRDEQVLRAASAHRLRSRVRGRAAVLRPRSRAPLEQRPSAEPGRRNGQRGGVPAERQVRARGRGQERARLLGALPWPSGPLGCPAQQAVPVPSPRCAPGVGPRCGAGRPGSARRSSPAHSTVRALVAAAADGPQQSSAAAAGQHGAAAPRPGSPAGASRRQVHSAARTSAAAPRPTDAPGAERTPDARFDLTAPRTAVPAPPGPRPRAAPRACAWAAPERLGLPAAEPLPRTPTAMRQRGARPACAATVTWAGQGGRPSVPGWWQSPAERQRQRQRRPRGASR